MTELSIDVASSKEHDTYATALSSIFVLYALCHFSNTLATEQVRREIAVKILTTY